MSLAPPPSVFPSINVETVAAGLLLHRNHHGSFGPIAFNPGRGQPSRFAPFAHAISGMTIPTLYAATSREAAAHETVFHDVEATDLLKTVRKSVLDARVASRIEARRDLKVATLFAPDLLSWGLTRRDLIDTPKTAYAQTVAWARAIHGADASLDGLVWTSRRCDPERCILLFGDRVEASAFAIVESVAVATDAALMNEFRAMARRAGINIVI